MTDYLINNVSAQDIIKKMNEVIAIINTLPEHTEPTPLPPIAAFTATITSGVLPLTVQFTDASANTPTAWVWSFGDGDESVVQNPMHTYQSTGIYNVSLTVTNAAGTNTKTIDGYITVFDAPEGVAPIADFVADILTGLPPLNVQFTNKTVGTAPITYTWDFSDDIGSTEQNPTWRFWTEKKYSITLTAKNAFGSHSVTKEDYITIGTTPEPEPEPEPQPDPNVDPSYGAGTVYDGNPIGGGAGYTRIIVPTDATYMVTTKTELIAALSAATSGQIVYVSGTATIDLTGEKPISIPAGVILASDRGLNGSLGALIKKPVGCRSVGWAEPAFQCAGNNVRITGIRLEGEMFPSTDSPVISESLYQVGIYTKDHTGLEVDNCEICGWAWSGVYTSNENTPGANGMYVHHNYIHYCQARSEGYGIQVDGASVIIEANIFDNNRHSIAAGGLSGEAYEARYNIHLGHGTGIGFSHFDIHGSAGETYKMHHNTFQKTTEWCIGIQSAGHKSTYITKNVINTTYGCNEPVFQVGGKGNLFVSDNYCNGTLFAGDEIVGNY